MKDYRELTICGTRDVLLATVAEIEKRLRDGWVRNEKIEKEGRIRGSLTSDDLEFCFSCSQTVSRKASLLVLMSNRAGKLWLSNIVPDELGQLTYDEFNYILEEFLQKFAKPAAAVTGATLETSSGVVTIDDWFSQSTSDKLRRFLKLTHGSTAHLSDSNLWIDFVIAAHSEGADVHGDMLRRWLIEDAGCPEYRADNLVAKYQNIQEYERRKAELVGA